MIECLLALILEFNRPQLSPLAADSLVLLYVSTPTELPDQLPPELGPAIERLWRRDQIWNLSCPWTSDRVRSEIYWTRQHWPASHLPDIADVDRLPTLAEVDRAVLNCSWLRDRLDDLESVAPPWESENVAVQRAEIQACFNLCYTLRSARRENNWIYQRIAMGELRLTIGDEAWVSGNWPALFPWWRVPLTQ